MFQETVVTVRAFVGNLKANSRTRHRREREIDYEGRERRKSRKEPAPMMQGLHHQQQQLAALLNVALPKAVSGGSGGGDSTTTTTSTSSAPSSTNNNNPSAVAAAAAAKEEDEASRLAAINSLHRAILYPPNSLLVTHTASFLSQGFSQLLSDK